MAAINSVSLLTWKDGILRVGVGHGGKGVEAGTQ